MGVGPSKWFVVGAEGVGGNYLCQHRVVPVSFIASTARFGVGWRRPPRLTCWDESGCEALLRSWT